MERRPRLTIEAARQAAQRFKSLFPVEAYGRWHFAGAIRREESSVAEVVHVVIPIMDHAKVDEPRRRALGMHGPINPIWAHLDTIMAAGEAYGNYLPGVGYDWTEHHRAVLFHGARHEIICIAPRFWGVALLAGTGPEPFVLRIGERLKKRGLEVQRGLILAKGDRKASASTEEEVFRIAGVPFVPPNQRKE